MIGDMRKKSINTPCRQQNSPSDQENKSRLLPLISKEKLKQSASPNADECPLLLGFSGIAAVTFLQGFYETTH
jgi:hypothetical protein